MSSTDMAVLLLVIALIFLIVNTLDNPLIMIGTRLIESTRVKVGPFIHVLERDGDRLFVIEPEQTLLYNTAGLIYYYFEGGASRRFCPVGEQAIVRIGLTDIGLINENGIYNVSCTNTSSWDLYEHFKNDSFEWKLPTFYEKTSIIDIINELIRYGYVRIGYQ
ncbi:unknown [Cryptophlebia leucotreta granulovirus]|uniref:Uncharacterized 18.6 kDa protein in P143-LEF5 intergenic region n=1 Tax=Cryptophlebia leucotreta granulosis virus TaxID=35254 RepID=Y096_GVCL|nr:hypothetical protein [Cryptophlebia leucotreta granulovirus]P41728.1 RecName: Full=Uncharacterized 18.6 kDa protein in P143-LEF5 intergenic region [Cryptophlebia leucotreta granulovirus]AAQ21675.1 unknown [Cryptophlebia leucotreta granulovirus]